MLAATPIRCLAWLSRSFPNLPGRWRLIRWLERRPATLARLGPQVVRFGRDYRLCVDPRDENGRRVFLYGLDWHERLTRHFARLLRPGDHVLDVGANLGYFTFVASELVGPAGSVTAFEAAPPTLEVLQHNVTLNPKAPIRLFPDAVSDQFGTVRFHLAADHETGYSSVRNLGDAAGDVCAVPTRPLDSLLDELPPIRLIKIDVEGAEWQVLRGARRLIERDHPYLIFEVDDGFLRELGRSAAALCRLVTEHGYRLERIGPAGRRVPVTEPPTDRCNLLASPLPSVPRRSAAAREPACATSLA